MTKIKTFKYKGKVLTPLTPAEALSLDKGDFIKFIGIADPARDNWGTVYGNFHRRVFVLSQRPEVHAKKITILFFGRKLSCLIEELALVERGDPTGIEMRRAERLIPINLKGFKRNISEVIRRAQENIDGYLNNLPLHKKLELFKNLSPEEKVIYDCLYKDIEALIGLKKEESDEPN